MRPFRRQSAPIPKTSEPLYILKAPPNHPVEYASGLCVITENGAFYIKNRGRYRIVTERVLTSWRFGTIINSSEIALSKYSILGRLGFRDGTLLKNIADGKLYLISDSKRRHILNPDWVEWYNLKDSIMLVSDEEVKIHDEGEPLS